MAGRCDTPVASGADAASVPWDEINANDWRPWSMQKPANAPGMWCQRGWFHGSGASNAKIECIVCYSEPDSHTEADLEHWTSCRRCSQAPFQSRKITLGSTPWQGARSRHA